MTINDGDNNQDFKRLGDRTLAAFLSKSDNALNFATYNYVNPSETNVVSSVPTRDLHLKWHYVYIGYSREDRKVAGYVKWEDK
jgi:hypothetical protein